MKAPSSLFLVIFIFVFTSSCIAQNGTLTKYFDSLWRPVTNESAHYVTHFIKSEGGNYQCLSYWAKTNQLYKKSFFLDTSFSKPVGLSVAYHLNGSIQDSVFFNKEHIIVDAWHYYANGQLICHYVYKKGSTNETEGFDEGGKKIENFIYGREAEFPGGNEAWMEYLSSNIKDKLFAKNGAPEGKYRVIVAFAIDLDGRPVDISAETSNGYGMEEEVIRVIKKSPKWSYAIQYNKPVKAYRRQPLTFLIEKQ